MPCADSARSRRRASSRRSIQPSARSAFGISSSSERAVARPAPGLAEQHQPQRRGVDAAVVRRVRHLAGARQLAAPELVHDLARLLLAPGIVDAGPGSAPACAASPPPARGATDSSSSEVMIESRPNGAANQGMPAPTMVERHSTSKPRCSRKSISSRSFAQRRLEAALRHGDRASSLRRNALVLALQPARAARRRARVTTSASSPRRGSTTTSSIVDSPGEGCSSQRGPPVVDGARLGLHATPAVR